MKPEVVPMVGECSDIYRVIDRPDGGIEIHIVVPARFRNLWITRLGELTTSPDEIEYYEKD